MSNCTSLADPFLLLPGTNCDGSSNSSLSLNVNCSSHHQPSRSRRNSASDDRRTMSFTKSTALSRTKREMTLSSNAETLAPSSANNNLIEHQNFNCPLTMSGRDCRLCPSEILPNNYSYMSTKRYRSQSQSQSTRSIESQVPQSFSQQLRRRRVHSESLATSTTYTTNKKQEMSRPMMTSLCTKCKRDVSSCSGNDFCDEDSYGVKLNFKFNLTQPCGISEWNYEFASTLHRFIARFSAAIECPKEDGKFLCESGQCVNASLVCNKINDCSDSTDEFLDCASACNNTNCEHGCLPMRDATQPGFCYCKEGYKASGREKNRCADINECLTFGMCSQTCNNTKGGFQCGCIGGFKLDNSNRSCVPNDPKVVLMFGMKGSIRKYSIAEKEYTTFIEHRGTHVGIAYDSKNEYVYWSDIMDNEEAIFRAKLDGTGLERIVDTGLIGPEGLAYDWIGENIYFTDSNNSHIGVCTSDGTKCAVLVTESVDKPRDIAVNPNLGYMFWTDWGSMAAIIRAGMDGSTPLSIVSSNLHWPNGIVIDHGAGRIYWNDANSDTIETTTFQGEDRQVVRSTGMKHPFGIELFGDLLIWSDWSLGQIQSCNKFTGNNHTVFVKESHNLMNGLVVAHPANQPKLRENHCANTKCSHICTLTPSNSYRCQCPVGMRLSSKDKATCKDDSSKAKLLIVHNNILKTFRFDSIGRKLLQQYTLDTVQMIGSAIYNPLNDTVILSDSYTKKIYQYDLKAKKLEILVQRHIDSIKGMDIDVVGQNLYWADTMRKTVEVMSLRTKARFIILRETDRPMDLVLVPEIKLMFVAQVGQGGGKILKMNMNGYNRSVLIRISHGEPTALTYNREISAIFWVDAIQRTIEHVSLDGRSYSGTISSSGAPYGITSINDKIFWSDRYTQELRSIFVASNKQTPPIFIGDQTTPNNSTKESYLVGNFFAQISIISNDNSYAKELLNSHDCARNLTTGCSHICLISNNDTIGTCVCPDGLQLDADMKTCSEQKICFDTQFKCTDGRCISDDWKCDGTPDCETGEDEKDCETLKPCRKSDFVCESDKICVPGHWRCDGEHDCHDGSDEKNCTVKPCKTDSDFQCESGRCIPQSWHCDHQVDCPDSSDEKNCNFTCPETYFRCNGSLFNCISSDWVCDGYSDCYDGSDEHADCKTECSSGDFKCFNQKCVSKNKLCDEKDDCGDNSDESQCNTTTIIISPRASAISKESTITSSNGTSSSSNGTSSSRNDSRCAYNEFWCLSAECIRLTKTCDGTPDCMDGSDEGPDCVNACKSSNECAGQCYRTPKGSQCSCAAGMQLSEDRKSCEDINECVVFNPCDHYCSNTKGSFKCTCHPAYSLKSDYKSCKANGRPPIFLYEWDSRVYIAPQDLQSSTSIEAKPGAISGMDVDSYGGYVYWSNAMRGIVSRLNIDSKIPSETLITSLVTPTVLTYDWIFNNIYVISYASSTRSSKKRLVLKVCTLRQDIPEKLCSVLFHIMGDEVTSIKVAPDYKFLFWTEIVYSPYGGVTGIVRRGTIDGSEALTLAVDNVQEPKGLAIDHVRQRVLWADNVANTIEAVNFDGRNRQIIIPSEVRGGVSGLALFENWVMWNDKGKQFRCRVDMHSQCAHISIRGNEVSRHLNIMQQSLQPRAQNPCENNNCSYICVPSLSTSIRSRNARPYKCLCPDGYSSLDAYNIHCIPNHQLKTFTREEPIKSYDDYVQVSHGDYHMGEDDDNNNAFSPHRIHVDGGILEDPSYTDSGGSNKVPIILGVLAALVVVLVVVAYVLHRRNVHPKVLVRPYVQQWVKYVNEPVQRFFSDGNRSEPLNGDKHLYDEVYHSGGGSTYSNPGYEEIDGPNNLYTALDDFPKGQPRSFTDSGIMHSERNSMNEEDLDSHCISFSQTDRLIN